MNTNVSGIQILLFFSIIFLSHVITNLHIISVNDRLLMEVLILICISFVYKFIVVSRTMKLYSQNEMKGKRETLSSQVQGRFNSQQREKKKKIKFPLTVHTRFDDEYSAK